MALDQFLRFCLGLRWITPCILGDQLDLSASDHPISLTKEKRGPFLLLLTPSGKRSGQNRQEADLQWLWCLRNYFRNGIKANGSAGLE